MRTQPRRVLAALTGALLITAVTQGCGDSDESGGGGAGQTVNVLLGANTIYPDQQRQWFTEVSDRFAKENGGATVKFETFASPNDELTKIQTSVLSNQGPDVYALGTTFTPTAAATGAFETLGADQWAKIGGRDRFVPATLGISGPDPEHEVGIPFAQRPFVMAYNKDMLAAAGIDKPADSWDGLLQQAKKLTGDGSTAWRSRTPTATTRGSSSGPCRSRRATRSWTGRKRRSTTRARCSPTRRI